MFRRVTASRRVTAIVSSLLVLTLLLVAARRAPSARAEDEAVLLAAGDVAACLNPGAMATAKLLSKEPNAAVAMLGDGAYPASDPVRPEDLSATMFHLLGIDPRTEVRDALNRPLPISAGSPIPGILA